ncbi:MAG TPA: hypothetical protein VK561_09635, partial [Bradyrhizobium sp.]|nr:hypothetical protein [Bradyrhizobium sp.]
CLEALVSGQVRSVAELATVEGISDRYVSSLRRDKQGERRASIWMRNCRRMHTAGGRSPTDVANPANGAALEGARFWRSRPAG